MWVHSSQEICDRNPVQHTTKKTSGWMAPWFFIFLFDPQKKRRPRLSFEAAIQQGAYLGLAEQTAASATRRQIEHDLLTLKELLEAGALIHVEYHWIGAEPMLAYVFWHCRYPHLQKLPYHQLAIDF